jgi:hypothetical protein
MMDSSFLDRFSFSRECKYLPEAQEVAVLVKHGADENLARSVIRLFNVCRAEVGGKLIEPPSLRSAIAFISFHGMDSDSQIWTDTVVNKSPAESVEGLRQLFSEHWKG